MLSGPIYEGSKITFDDLFLMNADQLVKMYHHGHYGAIRDAALGELQRRGLRPVDKFHVDCTGGRRKILSS